MKIKGKKESKLNGPK